jgi:5-deoxy-glucuronate isomerase
MAMARKSVSLLRKIPAGEGLVTVVSKNDPVMKYVDMASAVLDEGQKLLLGDPARELGIVILSGHCTLSWGGGKEAVLRARVHPLDGWPHAVYVSAGRQIEMRALTRLEVVVFGAPVEPGEGSDSGPSVGAAAQEAEVCVVRPEDVQVLKIGKGNWYLEGTFIIYDRVPSKRLIVGETHVPAGNWCSSPPHSHDKDVEGQETQLEEIYYFRFRPAQGFGFQGVYTLDGELEEAYRIQDGDVVLVPRGMHPNVAGPGYEMYMLWGMAGPRKEWIPYEDPAHNWLGSVRG